MELYTFTNLNILKNKISIACWLFIPYYRMCTLSTLMHIDGTTFALHLLNYVLRVSKCLECTYYDQYLRKCERIYSMIMQWCVDVASIILHNGISCAKFIVISDIVYVVASTDEPKISENDNVIIWALHNWVTTKVNNNNF